MAEDSRAMQHLQQQHWQSSSQTSRAQEAQEALKEKLADAQVAHRRLQQAVHQLGKHNMALEGKLAVAVAQAATQGEGKSTVVHLSEQEIGMHTAKHKEDMEVLVRQVQQATTDKRLYKALCKVAVAVASDIVNGECVILFMVGVLSV